jgi:hypothetical protein
MDELFRKYYFLAGRMHHVNSTEYDAETNLVGCTCGWIAHGFVLADAVAQVGRDHVENKARELYYILERRPAP